jgi:hypothetical protein
MRHSPRVAVLFFVISMPVLRLFVEKALHMTDSSELTSLPLSLGSLCDTTIDLARRMDALIRHVVKEQGWAELRIVIKHGVPTQLFVERSFKLD